jgi:hypothetical protein
LTSASPYVSLWTFRSEASTSYVPTFSPVFSGDCATPWGECAATTGTQIFRDGFGGNLAWGAFGGAIVGASTCLRRVFFGESWEGPCGDLGGINGFNVMLMVFRDPTDFVQISGGFYTSDNTVLIGFDDGLNSNAIVSRSSANYQDCGLFDNGPCIGSATLTAASATIKYAIAGGWSNGTSLDDLRFNVPDKSVGVPEPGALSLIALGLIGAGFARRKRRN